VKKKYEPDDHLLIPFFSAFRGPESPVASFVWPIVLPVASCSELLSVGDFHVREQKSRLGISSRSFTEIVIIHVT